jgi:hypothetical protein
VIRMKGDSAGGCHIGRPWKVTLVKRRGRDPREVRK